MCRLWTKDANIMNAMSTPREYNRSNIGINIATIIYNLQFINHQ